MIGADVLAVFADLSQTQRWIATAAVLAVVLASSWAIRRIGRWLRENYDPEGSTLEAIQAALIVALSVGAIWAVVEVWSATQAARALRDALSLDSQAAVRLLVTVFLLLGAWGATVFLKRVIEVLFREHHALTRHQREVGYNLAQIVLYLVATVAAVAVWGVNIGNVLLGAGFLSVVLGLAARQTLASVLAGFILLFGRPFDIGDWVAVNDREGIVTDVSIFNTELRTVHGEYVLIPNDVVTSTSLVNRSRRGRLRVDLPVGVDYDTDLEQARTLATETVEETECGPLIEHPEPRTVLTSFGDSAVVMEVRFWIDDPSAERRWRAQTAVVEAIKSAFEREDITIPFPQRSLSGRHAEGLQLQGEAIGSPQGDGSDGS